jgi:YrbI family 3-deoxy-D-manno-octulosonate 8-phosphate phosphatase
LKEKAESGQQKVESRKQKAEIQDVVSGQASEVRGPVVPSSRGPVVRADEIAYVGNDVNDLDCMKWVGLPIAVADAAPEVLAVAKWVTSKPGGHGAVREVCDLLLTAKSRK